MSVGSCALFADSEQAYYMRCTIPDCKGNGDGIDYNLGPFMSQTMLLSYGYIFVQVCTGQCTNYDFTHTLQACF